MDKERLSRIAKEVRRDIIEMVGIAGSGHPGGSLSAVEIMVYLYFEHMKFKPQNPEWENRDRFVLSKGHAAPALYSILSILGIIKKEELKTLRKIGSRLQGHPSRVLTPGVEASTGSLGQGFSIAQGIAIAGKIDKKDYRVYALLGDGEMEEGAVWETAMSAHRFALDNLCAILDNNNLQIDGTIEEIKKPYPLKEKWEAFGWNTLEIDGHNFDEIETALKNAKGTKGKPTMIIAHTIKGKGVSFMEGKKEWHGKAPKGEQLKQAIWELS